MVLKVLTDRRFWWFDGFGGFDGFNSSYWWF